MDGKTMMEWVKTVLYYYHCEYTGTVLDTADIRTIADKISQEEIDDPLKPYVDKALRKILEKNGGRSPFKPDQCCNINYVGMIPFGAVEKYVDEMYAIIPPNPDYLNAEITCLNDKLMFMFTQFFDDTSIVESFADYFASKGIAVHNYREEHLRHALIRMHSYQREV